MVVTMMQAIVDVLNSKIVIRYYVVYAESPLKYAVSVANRMLEETKAIQDAMTTTMKAKYNPFYNLVQSVLKNIVGDFLDVAMKMGEKMLTHLSNDNKDTSKYLSYLEPLLVKKNLKKLCPVDMLKELMAEPVAGPYFKKVLPVQNYMVGMTEYVSELEDQAIKAGLACLKEAVKDVDDYQLTLSWYDEDYNQGGPVMLPGHVDPHYHADPHAHADGKAHVVKKYKPPPPGKGERISIANHTIHHEWWEEPEQYDEKRWDGQMDFGNETVAHEAWFQKPQDFASIKMFTHTKNKKVQALPEFQLAYGQEC